MRTAAVDSPFEKLFMTDLTSSAALPGISSSFMMALSMSMTCSPFMVHVADLPSSLFVKPAASTMVPPVVMVLSSFMSLSMRATTPFMLLYCSRTTAIWPSISSALMLKLSGSGALPSLTI